MDIPQRADCYPSRRRLTSLSRLTDIPHRAGLRLLPHQAATWPWLA